MLERQVEIGDGASLDHCVVLRGVTIGAGAKIRNAIIDRGAVIPEGARIGYGNDSRRFTVSPGGIVVVVQDYRYPEPGEEEEILKTLVPSIEEENLQEDRVQFSERIKTAAPEEHQEIV